MKIAGLIVAAGEGIRAGGDVPKQYQDLNGQAVLARTVQAISPFVDVVQVVIGESHAEIAHEILSGLRVLPLVQGGSSRNLSVLAGLEALKSQAPDIVLIHDAARPFVDRDVVLPVIEALKKVQGAFPVLPVVDALWRDDEPFDRTGIVRAQTPQGFRFADILAAHEAFDGDAKDDIEVAIASGLSIAQTTGSEDNTKLTTAADIARARNQTSNTQTATGVGYDVHAFTAGDHVILCGVEISHSKSLKGHSDADVAMHAITDAIFGAIAEGDIGQWFPPSEAEWKGASSDIFLRKAVERVRARGLSIAHIDCTIVCEWPKIGPHTQAMKENIAQITNVPTQQISIKATTSERLGFTGREEGIASIATATVRSL